MGVHLQTKELLISDIIFLRSLVGYLGEKNLYNWWDTLFLTTTGLEFLKINFPRTAFSSGINSVSEAAKHVHDKFIGRGRVYHLFRMPSAFEEDVHFHLLHKSIQDIDKLVQAIQNKETALFALNEFAGVSIKSYEGPVHVGSTKDIMHGSLLSEIAKYYVDAFAKDKKVYPYFTE